MLTNILIQFIDIFDILIHSRVAQVMQMHGYTIPVFIPIILFIVIFFQHGCTMESCFDRLIKLERVEDVACQKCSEQTCSIKKIKTNIKRLFLRQTTISKVWIIQHDE